MKEPEQNPFHVGRKGVMENIYGNSLKTPRDDTIP